MRQKQHQSNADAEMVMQEASYTYEHVSNKAAYISDKHQSEATHLTKLWCFSLTLNAILITNTKCTHAL